MQLNCRILDAINSIATFTIRFPNKFKVMHESNPSMLIPPPGHPGAFACLVRPRGGAFACEPLPGGGAFEMMILLF